ncbi:Glucosyltransferase-like protein [Tulasnella sp. 403]|nr:Glucosyltransferase-like protein [Tulasnella sp. 403]
MKIVVTGSSGAVASGIINLTLSCTKHSLILVDHRPPPPTAILDNPRIEYVTAELRTYATFLEIMTSKRADALIHLGAYPNPYLDHASEIHNTNVILSYNALQAAMEAGIKRVVMASSINATGACYSQHDPVYDYFPLDEHHPMRPEDAYSLSKAILELQCDAFARLNPEMSIASLRFHHCVLKKKQLGDRVRETRKDLWGYTLVESAARACLLALDVPWKGHEVMLIVSNQHAAEGYNAEELATKYFPKTKRKSRSLSPNQGFYDCSKAERLLGWKHEGGKQVFAFAGRLPVATLASSHSPRARGTSYYNMDLKVSRANASPSASVASTSVRSRVESETDYEEILAPRPRHSYAPLQTWLKTYEEGESPLRTSSPLNPASNRHARKHSFPTLPTSPSEALSPPAVPPQRRFTTDFGAPSTLRDARMDSPTRRWVRWMVKMHLRDWIVPLSIVSVVWVKWNIGLGGYSGFQTPPLHGDYEAQRHWMEITLHLPTRLWYSYDLQYWGLDYPPLTAYISYLCGFVANMINPAWVALDTSRGFEDAASKVFMRSSVLFLDLMIYIPSVVWFTKSCSLTKLALQNIALLTILLQPALILVDNGHFQYNSVMLGFTLLALNLMNAGHDAWGAVAFVLSLCFKQMALYYSPAIFAYLFGRCIILPRPKGVVHLAKLGVATVLSFLILFAPFIFQSFPSLLTQSIIRIFPFNRGLFEDKVANFWCATNVLVKWRNRFSPTLLPKLATLFTLLGILPPMLHVLLISWGLQEVDTPSPTLTTAEPINESLVDSPISPATLSPVTPRSRVTSNTTRTQTSLAPSTIPIPKSPTLKFTPSPTIQLLPLALFNCSMAFFLFSFQVHEKSILLPLLPLTLIMSGRSEVDVDSGTWEWGVLVNNTAVFSMWPLLKKDGLGLQYGALTLLWNYVIGYNPLTLSRSFIKTISIAVYAAIATLHSAECIFSPPARYPDLFTVLNVLVSGSVFGLAWLWGLRKQFEAGWAIGGLSATGPREPTKNSVLLRTPNPQAGCLGVPSSSSGNKRKTLDPRVLQDWSKANGTTRSQATGTVEGDGSPQGLRLRRNDSITTNLKD